MTNLKIKTIRRTTSDEFDAAVNLFTQSNKIIVRATQTHHRPDSYIAVIFYEDVK